MTETRQEKKSERMEVRLGYSEKQSFVEACDIQGDTPSGAVRRFISGYTRRSSDDMMGEANRRLMRRYGAGVGIFIAVGAAFFIAASIWPLQDSGQAAELIETTDMTELRAALERANNQPQRGERLTGQAALDAAKAAGPQPTPAIDRADFDVLDKNRDGVLMRGEILPSDHHIHRLLNIDGRTGITPEEFYPRGNMHYKIAESWDMKADGASQRLAHTGSEETIAVEYDLTQSPPLIHAARPLEDAVIARPDRTVIWAKDETKPFLVFSNASHKVRKPEP